MLLTFSWKYHHGERRGVRPLNLSYSSKNTKQNVTKIVKKLHPPTSIRQIAPPLREGACYSAILCKVQLPRRDFCSVEFGTLLPFLSNCFTCEERESKEVAFFGCKFKQNRRFDMSIVRSGRSSIYHVIAGIGLAPRSMLTSWRCTKYFVKEVPQRKEPLSHFIYILENFQFRSSVDWTFLLRNFLIKELLCRVGKKHPCPGTSLSKKKRGTSTSKHFWVWNFFRRVAADFRSNKQQHLI